MKGAGGGGSGGGVLGLDMGGSWEVRGSHYSLLLSCNSVEVFVSFLVRCLLPPSPSFLLSLWTCLWVNPLATQNSIFFMVPICFIHPQLTLFLSSFYFWLFDSRSIPHSLPSNILTPTNISCLISFFPASFSFTTLFLLLSIICISYSHSAPPSLSH